MSDDALRALERAASGGDESAEARRKEELRRVGRDPYVPLVAVLRELAASRFYTCAMRVGCGKLHLSLTNFYVMGPRKPPEGWNPEKVTDRVLPYIPLMGHEVWWCSMRLCADCAQELANGPTPYGHAMEVRNDHHYAVALPLVPGIIEEFERRYPGILRSAP